MNGCKSWISIVDRLCSGCGGEDEMAVAGEKCGKWTVD